ncbi:MAG: hypothetical protein KAT05_10005, partial [Spirochaetes bacterium]|nr:hypothetical protein [Spirochaetota bacterium]
MPLAKLKIIIFSSVLFIFSAFIIIAVTINFYDQNSFLNTIENKIVTLYNRYSTKKTDAAHKKNITSTNKTVQALDNYYVINIENKISSELFLNLLYYLGDTSTDYVVIDANFNNLSDSLDLNETKKFIKTKDNFFGVIEIRNFKGLNIRPNRFLKNKKLLKNFLYLKKTKYPFIYSNYLGLIKIENQFFISPDKIGLISKKNMIFDQNNIDALYKFDNKFLFSLPSLIYIKNKEQDINNINFLFFSINYKNKKLYYDQKGRMSFKHNINKQKAPHVYNFTDWNEALQARINTIKKIKKLNLFKSQKKGFQLYKEEKKIINSIYNFPEIQDDKANTTLTIAKNEASLWKGFKTSNLDKIKQSKIFIVQNGNFAWVSDFIFQKNILNYGKNLKRIPLSFTILFSIILLFLIFLCVFFIKKNIVSFIICLTLALLNFSLYFIFRILLNIDIPFLTLLIIIIYGFLGGLLLRVFNYKIWIKEVKSIFKGSVSKKYAKEIANYWKNKKWSLESKAYLCTFVHIDTSTFLQKDITEDEVEVIGNKNSEIETIIKNNCGIRNNFNPAEILCYFGNPAIYKNHAQKA